MTSDGRFLKISCIVALFAGIASIAFGVFYAVGNLADMDAWVTAAEGLCSSVFGARCAILANVPSNTSKIKMKALIVSVLALAVGGYFLYLKTGIEVSQICLAAIICVAAIVAFFVASKIVKDQLRK